MAPKLARGGGDADIRASTSANRMRGRVVLLQGLILLHLATTCVASVDEFMTCDRILEKKRTARLLDEIPCDMTSKSYCEHKGNGYPEAQIWRFKEENRALMRRLYGDLESNSVYREMRSNMEMAAKLERPTKKQEKEAKEASPAASPDNILPLDHNLFSSLEYNIRLGSGHSPVGTVPGGMREQAVGEASKRRPPLKKIKLIKKKRLKKKPSSAGSEGAEDSTTAEGGMDADHPPQEAQQMGSTAQSQVPSFAQLAFDLDSLEKYVGEMLPNQGSESTEDREAPAEPIAQAGSVAAQVSAVGESDDVMDEYEYEEVLEEVELDEVDESEDVNGGVVEGGYGSAGDIYSGTSVNACPVKEEVFAPYWANNTRDQVLALLNLYPFEQYIHMETCKFPEEEMMCRKGCRCEQQYRLHRLLAFDPSNECRGIFSDWFRFPSYCICKCYNVVEETFLFNQDSGASITRAEKSLPGSATKAAAAATAEAEQVSEPSSSVEHRNIPAILPYEVKEALLRDMREGDTKAAKETAEKRQVTQTFSSSTTTSTPTPPPAVSDNVVDVTEEEAKKQSNHFFYGNAPVTEYRPDNDDEGASTGAAVRQKTPR